MSYKMSLAEFNALPAAARVSLRRFGQRTRLYRSDVVLAAGVAQEIALNTPDRLSLDIADTGLSNPLTITADGGKTVAQGLPLSAAGGAFSRNALEDGEATGYSYFGISTSGTTVHVEEVVGYGDTVELPPGVTPL